MMMDHGSALGIQQDLYNDAERHLGQSPRFPPEQCSMLDCHTKLSQEDVGTAAMLANAYLGLGCEDGAEADLRALLRVYCLESVKRADLMRMVASH